MKILGIESSCDETGAAIVENGTTILSNALASSMDLQAQFGGVVPEIAARSHIESIIPVIKQTFLDSHLSWNDIDGIAVTNGAGLIGSLLIGVLTARSLAIIKNKPLYAINHVEAHVYANFLIKPQPKLPMLALIVSGGHTQLVYFKTHFNYRLLGQTQDDAIGEAFDKVARILGLPYPGGPSIAKAAQNGNDKAYKLPKSKIAGIYNFSFSGLKTATLRIAQQAAGGDYKMLSQDIPKRLNIDQKNDIAASFQSTAIDILITKTLQAYVDLKPASVVIAGGVAANQLLRDKLQKILPITVHYAPISLCTDNAAMVAALGCFKYDLKQTVTDPYRLAASPNLKM